jgi:O-acetyl-ADP-ribose deacetylase (regulator of RNase III)
MRECLRLADKFDKNSIAFIITMTWKELGYPTDMVVSMMYGAVAEFDSSYSKTSLKEINIVEDDETIKVCILR